MSEPEPKTEVENPEPENADEYKRTTLYLRDWVKKDYERWFGLLELDMLDHDSSVVKNAEKREMHEALVATAISNSEEFVDMLHDRCYDYERFEVEMKNLLP